jgi:prolactin regulatory element-binding protein
MFSLCRFFDWDEVKDNEDHKLGLKPSKKVLTQLEDVGQQLALAFNSDSSVLAVGGEVESSLHFLPLISM